VAELSLYRRILGPRFDVLPAPLRRFHDDPAGGRGRGRFVVDRGRGRLARMLGGVLRFPAAGHDVPVTLRVSVEGDRERWMRDFGGTRLTSVQEGGEHWLRERIGPFRFRFRVSADPSGMTFRLDRVSIGAIPLPRFFAPWIEVDVLGEEDGWRVRLQVSWSWVGRILAYDGRIVPE